MARDDPEKVIELVATWLYRDQHDWSRDHVWADLPEHEREVYLRRARTIADMYSFPYAVRVLDQFELLCPCDPNPETTEGPLRECPIHGQWPDSVVAIAQAVRIADAAREYVMAGLCGNEHADQQATLRRLIELARTDR